MAASPWFKYERRRQILLRYGILLFRNFPFSESLFRFHFTSDRVSTSQFVEIARKSLEICNKYNVPLLINDRLDIALAVGAHGVHLGQTDMPVHIARRLLPPNAIIGKTCNNVEHVTQAVEEGVDYVGLGPVWGTKTKDVTAPLTGPRGIGVMLDALEGSEVKAVAIGEFYQWP